MTNGDIMYWDQDLLLVEIQSKLCKVFLVLRIREKRTVILAFDALCMLITDFIRLVQVLSWLSIVYTKNLILYTDHFTMVQ